MNKIKIIIIILIFGLEINIHSQEAHITNKQYTENTAENNISVVYPHIDFGPDALMGMRGVAGDINLAVDTLVMEQVHIFRTYINETDTKKPGITGKNELTITYDTVYYNSNFFSFRFHVFSSPLIAAHPNTYDVSFNYCPTSSSGLLKIPDLFIPNSGYLQNISNKCFSTLRKIAKEKGISDPDEMITKGAAADTANFEVFNVTKDNLIIIFNPAIVMPSVYGIQIVSIPLADLKGMIDPKGPLMEVK